MNIFISPFTLAGNDKNLKIAIQCSHIRVNGWLLFIPTDVKPIKLSQGKMLLCLAQLSLIKYKWLLFFKLPLVIYCISSGTRVLLEEFN